MNDVLREQNQMIDKHLKKERERMHLKSLLMPQRQSAKKEERVPNKEG
jgi:hypothetical protein